MTQKKNLLLLFVLGIVFLTGCGSSRDVVATIGDEVLTLGDFETRYAKYNGGWDKASKDSLDKLQGFLDLLVKFRLKVMEARRRGLAEDPAIKAELELYRLTIGASYVAEKELVDPAVRELYNRKKEMIRARHILIRVTPAASPDDTLRAYSRAQELLAQATPATFDSLARAYSEDPSGKSNGGDLGFFSQGRMVREFEDAVYGLKVGEISKAPIRTNYGYHIIYVVDRRPHEGSVSVAHILKRFNDQRSDTAAVTDSVNAIYDSLKHGMPFDIAAATYSDDPYTKGTGGDIGSYERDRMPLSIADALFATPVNSFTPPVRMDYGYHILKVLGKQPIAPFETVEKDFRTMFRERFYTKAYEDFVRNLKTQQQLTFDQDTYEILQHSFDTTKVVGSAGWSDTLSAEMLQRKLFSYSGKNFLVKDFVWLASSMEEFYATLLLPASIRRIVERLSELLVVNELIARSPDRYRELNEVMKEYEDGILLYRVEQDEVWKKIMVTDSALKEFYDRNREQYRWPKRVSFAEIQVRTDSLAKALYARAVAGEEFGALAKEFTQRAGFAEKGGEWGLVPETQNQLTRLATGMAVDSIAPPLLFEGKWSVIRKMGSDSVRVKTFEEARPEVTSGYQEYAAKEREKEWIGALRTRIGVVENSELLEKAFKRSAPVDRP